MARPVHSGIILPGHVERAGGRLTIHVPRGYEREEDYRAELEDAGGYHVCRVVVNAETEEICGATWPADQERAYLAHLRTCVSNHRDVIHAASPRTKMPFMDPNAWDPEVEAHMREVGRRMVKERRLEVKPSERAGFS